MNQRGKSSEWKSRELGATEQPEEMLVSFDDSSSREPGPIKKPGPIKNPSIKNPSINNPSINNPSINNPSINNPGETRESTGLDVPRGSSAGSTEDHRSIEARMVELVAQVTQLSQQMQTLEQQQPLLSDRDGPFAPEFPNGSIDGFDFRLQALEQRLRTRLEELEAEKAHGRDRLQQLRTTLRNHLDEVGNRDGSSGIWKWITGAAEAELKERIHETLRNAVEELDRVLDHMPADRQGSSTVDSADPDGTGPDSPE